MNTTTETTVSEASTEATTKRAYITTFYRFMPLTNVEQIQKDLEAKAESLGVRGLVILGNEGINSTVAAPSEEALELFKQWIGSYFQVGDMIYKNSYAPKIPFRRFKVKVRNEIVTLGTPELLPNSPKNHHLTPDEWNKVMKEESDFLLIDTRNWYEYKIGTFKGAVNPNIEQFNQFPEWLEQQNYPKDKKMLIFCTGGIRCEKGILELQRQGYDNVYQLEGGILKYIEDHPNDQYEGECFVFDHRVAVNQKLEPTEVYKLCPHCGQPSNVTISCKRCDSTAVICDLCETKDIAKDTCSKNCAHHYQMRPYLRGPKQIVPFELEKQSSGK